MPVYKRGRTWWVDLSVDGRRSRISAGHGITRAQALEFEAKLRGDWHAGRVGRRQSHSIEAALERWLNGEARALAHWKKIASVVNAWTPYLRGRDLVDAGDVANEARTAWLKEGLKPATINRRLAALRRVTRLAWKSWLWIDRPAMIELLPGERPGTLQLDKHQVNAILANAGSVKVRDAIMVIAHAGLRLGEVVNTKRWTLRNRRLDLDAHTKTGRPRRIPLTPEATAAAARLARDPIKYDALRYGFRQARRRARMPWVTMRDLRRTFGSWIVQRTKSLKAAQDLLGHSTVAITARHYAHLLDEHLVKAVATLPRLHAAQIRHSRIREKR